MMVTLLAVAALSVLMLVNHLQRKKGGKLTVRDRFLGSLTPAMIGAGLGFSYARYTIPPEAIETSTLPGMYACMGAVIAILSLRGFALLRVMYLDFFGSEPES